MHNKPKTSDEETPEHWHQCDKWISSLGAVNCTKGRNKNICTSLQEIPFILFLFFVGTLQLLCSWQGTYLSRNIWSLFSTMQLGTLSEVLHRLAVRENPTSGLQYSSVRHKGAPLWCSRALSNHSHNWIYITSNYMASSYVVLPLSLITMLLALNPVC